MFSDQKREELRVRFISLIQRHSEFTSERAHASFADLFSRYTESHRSYHTIQHISHCLWELDHADTSGVNRDELELAIWYHDAIYEIMSKTNEERSVELMRSHLKGTQVDLDAVAELILASKHLSGGAPRSPANDLFLDIDLAVLGQRELDYGIYQRQVREEYGSIGPLRYAIGRKRVLRHFQRMQIYRTPAFQDRYETQAKANLSRELKKYWWIPLL